MIHHPSRFHTIVKTLRQLHIVDRGILRFAESQMDTEEKRMRVYNAWVVFRHLHFDLAIMAEKINDHPISITVLLGKYDKVIPIRHIQRFVAKLHRAKLEIANAGHNDLVAKAGTFLSP
jgi:hypothetical protein